MTAGRCDRGKNYPVEGFWTNKAILAGTWDISPPPRYLSSWEALDENDILNFPEKGM